jgi:MFS family permease
MRIKGDLTKGIVWQEFIPALIVVVNSLTWNTFILSVFSGAINSLKIPSDEILLLFSIEFISIAISAILGSKFFPSSRRALLALWMAMGSLAPILLTTIPNNGMLINSLVCVFFGISVGAGLPSTLACFADATTTENRGFFGGVTFAFVGLSSIFFVAATIFFGDTIEIVIMTLWRLAGMVLFLATYKTKKTNEEQTAPPYSNILGQRDFVLYLLPWIMFCMINWIEAPLLANLFGNLYNLIGFVEVVLAGVSALVGGIIADHAGRKRVVMIGFVILGVDYVILSLISGMEVAGYIYAILDSVAWGMFASVFFMTLWGDLGRNHIKEKYYTLGGLPYLLAMFLSELVNPYVGMMPLATTFSLASFFLFLAVVPLMYAPETLPEKKVRERELRDYLEKAKKTKEKYA